MAPLLPAMMREGLFDRQAFNSGLVEFLDTYDDLTMDVPLVGKATAFILASCLMPSDECFDLATFLTIPEENMFR